MAAYPMHTYPVSVEVRPGQWRPRQAIRATTAWRALHTARILYREQGIELSLPGGPFRLLATEAMPSRFEFFREVTR